MLPRLGKHLIFHDNGYVFQVMAESLWEWPRSLQIFHAIPSSLFSAAAELAALKHPRRPTPVGCPQRADWQKANRGGSKGVCPFGRR